MKTRNLITSLAAIVAFGLWSCDKPQTIEEPPAPTKPIPVSEVCTYTEDPFTLDIVPKKTDVYVFSKTAQINFDTAIFIADRYRRTFYYTSEQPILHSPYDTIHYIKLPIGEYSVVLDNQFYTRPVSVFDTTQGYDTARWHHLRNVSVLDTVGFVIYDTFFRNEFYIEN